jgi:ethanolamine ammonia-lyase large subunit
MAENEVQVIVEDDRCGCECVRNPEYEKIDSLLTIMNSIYGVRNLFETPEQKTLVSDITTVVLQKVKTYVTKKE